MTDNVVIFPKGKLNHPPQTLEELRSTVDETRRGHIDYVVDNIVEMIFDITYHEGFDLHQDDKIETVVFMVEAIKAAIMDSKDMFHPLHEIAYEMVENEGLEEPTEGE